MNKHHASRIVYGEIGLKCIGKNNQTDFDVYYES